jgi:pyridoxine 5-phosphate synthase
VINLSVNINKIATLRNSRDINVPKLQDAVELCIQSGCQGITVHPRLDERHIRFSDLAVVKRAIRNRVEYNIECDPSPVFMKYVLELRPTQCTLVPTKPAEITSSDGFDLTRRGNEIQKTIQRLKSAGIRLSLFSRSDPKQIRMAKDIGADAVELYTGPYAVAVNRGAGAQEYRRLYRAAELAASLGLRVHAGHDLTLENLDRIARLPGLAEVSIGHHLIVAALFRGLGSTIASYAKILSRR